MHKEMDYLVIGGGSAGCVMAGRLSEDPNTTVALFEAGGQGDSWVVQTPAAAVAMLPWLRRSASEAPLSAADRKLLFWESFLGNFLFSIALTASKTVNTGDTLTLSSASLTITAPDGTVTELVMPQMSPGRFQIDWQAPMVGLYRLKQDDLTRVVAVGPAAPREFVETLASPVVLQPVVDTVQGGMPRLEEGFPALRAVREGRPAAGRGWLGYTPRGAYVTEDLRISPLVPGWLLLLLAAGLAVAAWLAEGRRRIRA